MSTAHVTVQPNSAKAPGLDIQGQSGTNFFKGQVKENFTYPTRQVA